MKGFIKIIFAVFVLLCFYSCKDLLDTKLTNEWTDEDTWTNPKMAEGVLISAYQGMMVWPDRYDGNFLDAATDNALTRNFDSDVYRLSMGGGLSIASNPIGNWSECYGRLQDINLFLEKGLTDSIRYYRADETLDARTKERLEGEAYFLRAWYQFLLLQMYGGRTAEGEVLGYTITTKFISEDEAAVAENFPRNTYEDCVEQIVEDCEKAFSLLPLTYTGSDVITGTTQAGRAHGLAAMALKSRVLLYAASPAFQSPDVVRINGIGDFTVLQPDVYKAKWARAANFAAEVLQLSGMTDFTTYTADDISDATETSVDEFLLRTLVGRNKTPETRHFPPFYLGKAQTIPSHNLAAAFPAANGFPTDDPRSLYDPNDPFAVARDRRFDLNIMYHGRMFGQDADALPIDVSEGGRDSETFHPYASRSGYYLAKFLNTKESKLLFPMAEIGDPRHYYAMIRKTEVWLNYAEAANEAWGPHTPAAGFGRSAYDVIKLVRQVSGGITDDTYISEKASSADDFREVIQNERRIEFAFENHRFWDLRRCLLPLDITVEGIKVARSGGGFDYRVVEVEERKYADVKFYYMPLPYSELAKNPALKNNMGWDNQ